MISIRPGTSFAGYQILAECGKGAYGRVFLVKDALGHQRALKFIESASSGEYEMKGLRNYMSLSPLPNSLLQIFHCGMEDGLLFYVMEAADNASSKPGEYIPDTLAGRLELQHHLPSTETLAIGNALLDGLEFLHNAGLLHRDIKPENIIFVNGTPKLADLGLTRNITETISFAGTPGYLAPEFLNGAKPSPATDIFALGKCLYHTATGMPPERYPELPRDIPVADLYQLFRPLLRICNSNPALRCKSCQEVRRLLPKKIQPHGVIRRFRDRLFLFPAFRREVLRFAGCTILALLLFSAMFVFHLSRRENIFVNLLARLKMEEESAPLLDMQLESLGEPPCAEELTNIRDLLNKGKLSAAEASLEKRSGEMASLAVRHIPPPVDPTATYAESFQQCARGWGLLASPLGKYMTEHQREELSTRLTEEMKQFEPFSPPRGAHLGLPFIDTSFTGFNMPFVAPGSFVSPTTHSVHHIDYPYWIHATEISTELFTFITNISATRTLPSEAVEYFSWNDWLRFCRELNDKLSLEHTLPPGYLIRIPTEEEWEFAALGGWANIIPPPREIPPHSRNRAPDRDTANPLGCLDFDDNLSEVCSPYPEMPPDLHGAGMLRGAEYNLKQTSIMRLDSYLHDHAFHGEVGLRPVLAPAPPDYYDTAWWRGPEVQSIELNGKIYAGFNTVHAALTWKAAAQLAEDLGASLPEPDDLALLPEIYGKLGLVPYFDCPIAIHFAEGEWRSLKTNVPVQWPDSFTQIPSSDAAVVGPHTSAHATTTGVIAIKETMGVATLLLRWDSPEAFAKRGEQFLKHAVLRTFELNGRHLAVCRAQFASYAYRPFAQFLGVKQPVLDTAPEALAALLANLTDQDPCVLGPIPYYAQWEQPDGTHFDLPSPPPVFQPRIYDTPALLVLGVQNGSLVQLNKAESFLVELPSPP